MIDISWIYPSINYFQIQDTLTGNTSSVEEGRDVGLHVINRGQSDDVVTRGSGFKPPAFPILPVAPRGAH